MMRSCLVYLAVFFALGILGGVVLAVTMPPPPPGYLIPFASKLVPALVASFIASGLLVVAIYGLKDTLQRLKDRARLGARTVYVPVDGERAAAFGTLVADGPLLESPFTATKCACYSYEVRRTTRGKGANDALYVWGYALTPSHIEAQWGAARLLSYTEIDDTPPRLTDPEVLRRAAVYFAVTPLEPTGYPAPGLGIEAVKRLHADMDGNISGDFGPLPPDFLEGDYRLYEKILGNREPISAIGTWDAALGGLKAEPGSNILAPVVVRKGSPETARRILMNQAIRGAIGVLILVAIAAAIVGAFVWKGAQYVYGG